jgi:hypothetical protein
MMPNGKHQNECKKKCVEGVFHGLSASRDQLRNTDRQLKARALIDNAPDALCAGSSQLKL